MIIDGKSYFVLNTDNTSYIFRITKSGHLEHLYYGSRIRVVDSLDGLIERQEFIPGNNNAYSAEFPQLTLNNLLLEASFEGRGDNREAFAVIENSDGSRTSDFLFEASEIDDVKEELSTMPSSYGLKGERSHLQISLIDKANELRLFLDYYVYEEENVITRTARLVNYGKKAVFIHQLMSAQLGINGGDYVMSTFNGAWAREMGRKDVTIKAGKHINSSYTGTSSSYANPLFMRSRETTTEDYGIAFGFNLIYSGNHAEIVEVNEFDKTRVLWGINPRGFKWRLESGEEFETPEAIMTFSFAGFNGLSTNFHRFIREHVTRGEWSKKERPVLLNSWEAAYFDINERKLLKLAKAAKEVGIELFVMDDGWFGERNDDTSSLGDWYPNKKKLPGGLKGLADKVNKLGLSFGLWVEPEMVSVNSNLYREHPDWAIQNPLKEHSEGRNQRILDLANPAVQDYIIEAMSKVFSSANIEYVKWDMNRTLTDIYSSYLAGLSDTYNYQGELTHRYIIGLYRCMKVLTERFPHILFEGCAAGGNRFDLGILSYFPQIWGSDDTDAIMRTDIQSGYSYGYPQSCWSAHVSGVPNHQTLRITPLETRFGVAAFGSMGYECNLCDMSRDDLAEVKRQVEVYKKFRKVFQYGQMYRGRTFRNSYGNENVTEWTVVSPDKEKAVGLIVQRLANPNMSYEYFRPRGLDRDKYYHFYNREIKVNIKEFGDLVNTVSPVHIKPGSVTQDILSKVYKLGGDYDSLNMFGSAIMGAGVKLLPAYAGTGFNDKTRVFADFAARVYYMEAIDIS